LCRLENVTLVPQFPLGPQMSSLPLRKAQSKKKVMPKIEKKEERPKGKSERVRRLDYPPRKARAKRAVLKGWKRGQENLQEKKRLHAFGLKKRGL